jgi:CxxC-x17-CxxC domain-containing protein
MQTMTKIKCDQCGKDAEVPFVPTPGRKVYCQTCFRTMKDQRKQEAGARILAATKGVSVVWSREVQNPC